MNRCIVCGKEVRSNVFMDKKNNPYYEIDKNDCYLIYKKLLGIYGREYLEMLNSC